MLKVPPSPSLSARRTMKAYLIVTMMVRDHMMSERTSIKSFFDGGAVKVDE